MKIRVETASAKHVPLLLAGLSPVIAGELKNLYPAMTLEECILKAFEVAAEADAFYVDDDLVAIAGVTVPSILGGSAFPWLLPHVEHVNKWRYQFLSASKLWINEVLRKYPVLENFGTVDNKKAIQWLKWVGFKMGPVININGHDYVSYRLARQ